MKELGIQFHTRKKELLQFAGFAAGGYLFGYIILIIIGGAVAEEIIPFLGTILAIAAVLLIHFFGIMFSFVEEFNMAISMGATRKSYVMGYLLFTIAELGVLEVLIGVLAAIESGLLEMFYPGVYNSGIGWYFQGKVLVAAAVGLPVMEIFLAALILRFGMKAFWGIWICFIFSMALLSNLTQSEKAAKLMQHFGLLADRQLTPEGLLTACVLLILLLAAGSWGLLRRQRVTI